MEIECGCKTKKYCEMVSEVAIIFVWSSKLILTNFYVLVCIEEKTCKKVENETSEKRPHWGNGDAK
jgi:hypothetical protein